MFTRRNFLAAGLAAGASGLAGASRAQTQAASTIVARPAPTNVPLPAFYGAITDEPYAIPAVPEGVLAQHLWRQQVPNPWPQYEEGTIVVDPDAALLHFVEGPDTATRYGVSVGAAGFDWEGTARLQYMRDWPRWKVPDSMIERQPELAPYSWRKGGMDPGPDNPMGARALYLFQNGEDTLYRVHGSAKPWELGKPVSSGCIRMLNQDVIHLAGRAVHGATVVVLPSHPWQGVGQLY